MPPVSRLREASRRWKGSKACFNLVVGHARSVIFDLDHGHAVLGEYPSPRRANRI